MKYILLGAVAAHNDLILPKFNRPLTPVDVSNRGDVTKGIVTWSQCDDGSHGFHMNLDSPYAPKPFAIGDKVVEFDFLGTFDKPIQYDDWQLIIYYQDQIWVHASYPAGTFDVNWGSTIYEGMPPDLVFPGHYKMKTWASMNGTQIMCAEGDYDV